MSQKFAENFLRYVISDRLMELMERTTQVKVEKETGITRQNLANYINGTALPNSATLYELAKYFGVSCDYLLGSEKTTTHEISDIADKTGLSQKAIEKLIYYVNDDSENKQNVIFAINQLLENDSSDFLLAFARYVATPKIDECDFSDRYFFNLYMKYFLLKPDSTMYEKLKKSELFDAIPTDEIVYYQLMKNFTTLVNRIKSDETTKRKYIRTVEEILGVEHEEAVWQYPNPDDMDVGEISFGNKR